MKKIICLMAAVAMCLGIGVSVFAEDQISVTIDGKAVAFPDQQPIEMNDRVLVPMRAIFEALGATVNWNDANQSVISQKAGISVQITVDSLIMLKNGKSQMLDQPAILLNDRVLVPVRVVAESFNSTVTWDDASKTVIIK